MNNLQNPTDNKALFDTLRRKNKLTTGTICGGFGSGFTLLCIYLQSPGVVGLKDIVMPLFGVYLIFTFLYFKICRDSRISERIIYSIVLVWTMANLILICTLRIPYIVPICIASQVVNFAFCRYCLPMDDNMGKSGIVCFFVLSSTPGAIFITLFYLLYDWLHRVRVLEELDAAIASGQEPDMWALSGLSRTFVVCISVVVLPTCFLIREFHPAAAGSSTFLISVLLLNLVTIIAHQELERTTFIERKIAEYHGQQASQFQGNMHD